MCEEEVRLGRRLAPSLYLGVRAVVARDGGHALAAEGAECAREHVVEMVRFDESRTLAARLRAGDVSEEEVRPGGPANRRVSLVGRARPLRELRPVPGGRDGHRELHHAPRDADRIGDRRLAAAHRFAAAFAARAARAAAARRARGFIRDCHGDLRAEHVLFGEEGVEIFDPVEFDPGLRQIDVGADLAFLVMELVEAGREDLARILVSASTARPGVTTAGTRSSGSTPPTAPGSAPRSPACAPRSSRTTLPGSASWSTRAGWPGSASDSSWRARRPMVMVVCGGAATGKTRLAESLAAAAGLAHLSSDVVRKQLAGLPPERPAPRSAYSEEASLTTYRELGAAAAAAVSRGRRARGRHVPAPRTSRRIRRGLRRRGTRAPSSWSAGRPPRWSPNGRGSRTRDRARHPTRRPRSPPASVRSSSSSTRWTRTAT